MDIYDLSLKNYDLQTKIMMLEEKLKHTEMERDHYFNQCKSYELWQNRAIERLKDMQIDH